jgi:AcrR family transcriptional regulator
MASQATDQPFRAAVLQAALDVFRTRGYAELTPETVAQQANVEPSAVHAQFPDKNSLLAALIAANTPTHELEAAFDSVVGQSAEDIMRDAMRRLIAIVTDHPVFVDLAVADVLNNDGASLVGLGIKILPKAFGLFKRLRDTGQLRPVSDLILARTLIAMLLGFIASEQALPKIGRVAMRLFPQRAWVDGMVDLMLYGVLEDNAR